jgi:hypothetical protein
MRASAGDFGDHRVRSAMSERDDRSDESQASAAGVDVTLIDEMLRMTVRQRLEQNDRMASLAVRLREAFEDPKA